MKKFIIDSFIIILALGIFKPANKNQQFTLIIPSLIKDIPFELFESYVDPQENDQTVKKISIFWEEIDLIDYKHNKKEKLASKIVINALFYIKHLLKTTLELTDPQYESLSEFTEILTALIEKNIDVKYIKENMKTENNKVLDAIESLYNSLEGFFKSSQTETKKKKNDNGESKNNKKEESKEKEILEDKSANTTIPKKEQNNFVEIICQNHPQKFSFKFLDNFMNHERFNSFFESYQNGLLNYFGASTLFQDGYEGFGILNKYLEKIDRGFPFYQYRVPFLNKKIENLQNFYEKPQKTIYDLYSFEEKQDRLLRDEKEHIFKESNI